MRRCWLKGSKGVISGRMPQLNPHTKEEKKAAPTVVEVKLFPGKALDASVFAEKFNAANECGRTIKGIKQHTNTVVSDQSVIAEPNEEKNEFTITARNNTTPPTQVPYKAATKRLKPGQAALKSGQYITVGPRGGQGKEITSTKGNTLPPAPGSAYKLVDGTKNKSGK